jgi:hypothetical protein
MNGQDQDKLKARKLCANIMVIRDGDCGDLYRKWTAVFVRYPEVEASAM